jgi:hypothetical protein
LEYNNLHNYAKPDHVPTSNLMVNS